MSQSNNYLRLVAEPGGSSVNLALYILEWQQKPTEIVNILCDTTAGALTVLMPRVSAIRGMVNAEFLFYDEGGNAGTNNVTITMGGSDTFNGANTTLILDSDEAKVLFRQTKNDQSTSSGTWLALMALSGFAPLFTNTATAGTQNYSYTAIPQAANTVFSGPLTGPDAPPTFKTLSALGLQVLTASAELDFGLVPAQQSADLEITVTGAALGDVVALGIPAVSVTGTGTAFFAYVKEANKVNVRFLNSSAVGVDAATGTFTVKVFK